MMKVDLYSVPTFEDKPEYVVTWKFDPKKYGHKRIIEVVYSDTQNLTKNGWGRDGGLNKDFRSTSVGDYVEVEGMRYYVKINMGFTRNEVDKFGRGEVMDRL